MDRLLFKLYIFTLNTLLSTAGEIIFRKSYVDVSDSFSVECVVDNGRTGFSSIKRDTKTCYNRCEDQSACADEAREVSVGCKDTLLWVNFSAAVEHDFTEWSCFDSDTLVMTKELQQFVATTLTCINCQEEIIQGKVYSYVCEAVNGDPGAIVKWYLDNDLQIVNVSDKNITRDGVNVTVSSFNLTANTDLQNKPLFCEAEQLPYKTYVREQELHLNVLFPPKKATGKQVEEGVIYESSVLECIVNVEDIGNPDKYNFTWTRDNDNTFNRSTEGGILHLTPTSVNDEDIYYCEPRNKAGSGLRGSIQFTVNSPPIPRSPDEQQYRLYYKDHLEVNCTVEGKPDLVMHQWNIPTDVVNIFLSKEGNKWSEGKLYLSSTILNWNSADQEDRHLGNGKVVTCHADNEIGIPLNHPLTINIEFEPGKAQLKLSIDKINVENQLDLTCNLDKPGNPGAHAYYFANDKDWENNMTGNVEIIDVININQEGVYRCAGINEPYNKGALFGETSDGQFLTVTVPPNIFDPIEAKLVNPIYGDDFDLVCVAAAKPEVQISWYKGDARISPDEGYFDNPVESSTPITDFYGLTEGKQSNMAWTSPNTAVTCESVTIYNGVYTCKAKREEDSHNTVQSSTITLQTWYPPIWTGNNTFVAEMNSSFTFTCSVCALPTVDANSYLWYKDGVLKEGETEKELHVEITRKTDFGMYECEPTNAVDSNRFPINLTESGPPVIKNLEINLNITSTAIPISWMIETFGGSPSLAFTIWTKHVSSSSYVLWRDDISVDVEEGDLVQIDVDGLAPDRQYDIKIVAESDKPSGDVMSQPLYTTGETRESLVIDIDAVLVSTYDLIVSWTFLQKVHNNQFEPYVTLCIKYWARDNGEESSIIYPSNGACVIKVFIGTEVIHGRFDPTSTYYIELIVYENGLPGSNSGNNFEASNADDADNTISPAGIAAIAVSIVLVLFIALVSVMLVSGMLNINRNFWNQKSQNAPTDKIEDETVSWDKAYSEIQMAQSQSEDQTYEKLRQQHYENTAFEQYETLDKLAGDSTDNV